jgi:hypothetical protein
MRDSFTPIQPTLSGAVHHTTVVILEDEKDLTACDKCASHDGLLRHTQMRATEGTDMVAIEVARQQPFRGA